MLLRWTLAIFKKLLLFAIFIFPFWKGCNCYSRRCFFYHFRQRTRAHGFIRTHNQPAHHEWLHSSLVRASAQALGPEIFLQANISNCKWPCHTIRGCRKIDLVPLNIQRGEGVDPVSFQWTLFKEKRSKKSLFYSAKSFTDRLETSEFHDSMILFTFSNWWISHRIAQEAA